MRIATLFALALTVGLTARAHFTNTTTQKTGGTMGAMAGASGDRNGKVYLKGQRMMTTSDDTATIMDFGAQTLTRINNAQKTYTVKKFAELTAAVGAGTDVKFDVTVNETGQKKVVNGFDAREVIMTMNVEMETGRGPAMKMQMEMDVWVSSGVPGADQMRAFFQKNKDNFPWSATAAGNGNPGMKKAIAQLQSKIAELKGVTVENIIRMKPAAGGAAMPQMTPDQAAKMQAAMAKMQEMQKQGGPGAAAMQQAMGRMGGMPGTGGGGALVEITIDSAGFSEASVPDSVFAIPAGYTKAN